MQQSGRYSARPYRGRLEQTRRCARKSMKNDRLCNPARHVFAPHQKKIVTEEVTTAAKEATRGFDDPHYRDGSASTNNLLEWVLPPLVICAVETHPVTPFHSHDGRVQ